MTESTPIDLTAGPVPGLVKTYRKTAVMQAARIDVPFVVDTLEGTMRGNAGDFLAIGVHGERYPIAAAVMAASYVEDEQQ